MTASDRAPAWVSTLPGWLSGSVAAAAGVETRDDPVHPGTGGPAGNARLTAWTGALLLVLFAAEGLTLVDLGATITWHIALGAALIPPTVLKIGSTGWRIMRYYAASPSYRRAGPPPLLLRMLGPLVVVTTAALLITGILLVLLGDVRSRTTVVAVGGLRLDWVWLHQASFVLWFAAMTLHVLGRLLPGAQIVREAVARPGVVPGLLLRLGVLLVVAVLGVACALLLVGADTTWSQGIAHHHDGRH